MPIVSSRSRDRGIPTISILGGSSSTATRGTTSPVVRTRKYPGHGLPFWWTSTGIGGIFDGSLMREVVATAVPTDYAKRVTFERRVDSKNKQMLTGEWKTADND